MGKVKWVEIGIDADVHDGERAVPAAAAARFSVDELSAQLGYPAGRAGDDDALGMAQLLIERVGQGLTWAEEPWVSSRVRGASALGSMGPGSVDKASWEALMGKFKGVCELYGNQAWRCGIGEPLDRALESWFAAKPAQGPERARRAPRG